VLPILVVMALLGTLFWAYSAYNKIDRIDLSDVLDPVAGDSTNYLLVGSDSRGEFDPEGDSGVTGRRSDTIIVLQTTPDGSAMMSVPRDLWVTVADTGEEGRINGAYNRGPANLVQTVKDNLDIPVNHYMEVGFGSFAGLVDALGGVTIDFPNPAFDDQSGLNQPVAGPVVLDGQQALAYARSRHYTEIVNGEEQTEPTADLGRQRAAHRSQGAVRLDQAEIDDHGARRTTAWILRDEDVAGLDVAVDIAALVHGVQGTQRGQHQREGLVARQALLGAPAQELLEVLPR